MTHTSSQPGYIFLVSVLVIGVIASVTAASLLLLGWAAEQNGLLIMQSARAFEYANTCAERVIHQLRIDHSYGGNVSQVFDYGSCDIEPVGGSGVMQRTVCVAGHSGNAIRRLEIDIDQLYPSVVVRTWRETSSFTLCP
jgi:hypothetical protein